MLATAIALPLNALADLCTAPGTTTLASSITTTDWCDLGNGEGLTVNPGVTYQTNHRPAITFSGGTVAQVTNRGSVIQDGADTPLINATATITGDLTNDGGTFSIINGTNTAIYFSTGSSLANIRNINGGQILGPANGLYLNGVTLTGAQGIVNDGTISAGGSYGLYLFDVTFSGGGGIANGGTISGNYRGIQVSGGISVPGGLTNSGTISGPANGYSVLDTVSFPKIDIMGASARFVSDVSAANADVTVKAGSTFANDNAFDVKSFTVEATATFNFGWGHRTAVARDGITVPGGFTNAGTVHVAAGDMPAIHGAYTQASSGVLQFGIANMGSPGWLQVSSATLPSAAKLDVVTGNNCAGVSIGQSAWVFSASSLSSDGTFAVTDDCSTMDFVASLNGYNVHLTAVAPNLAPTAGTVFLSGAAQVGQVLTGTYVYADAESNAENVSGSGTTYRFVRSTDNSVATGGDNVEVAAGTTGGTSRTYTPVAADFGSYFFYCVTPRASAGASPGAEACSSATAAVAKGTQAAFTASATPASIAFNATSALGTTGGSGTGAVSYAVTAGASSCSIAGTTLTGIAVGTCTVTATKAADASYNAATASVDVTVTKATQATLTASATPASIAFNATSALGTTGGSGTGAVSFAVTAGASSCSIAGSTVTGIAVGTCTITATKAADASYNAVSATVDITVTRASQAIVFGAAPALAVDQSATISAAGGASGQPVVLSVLTPTTCTLVGSTLSGTRAGTCTVAADQAGNANFDAAPQATVGIAVARGTQAIVFGPAPSLAIGGTGRLSATGGRSGNSVVYSSLTPAICTVSGDIATGTGSGSCTVAADQAGNADYLAAPQVTQAVLVSQSPPRLTLTVTPNPAKYRVPTHLRIEATGNFGPVEGFVEFRAGSVPVPGCARVAITAGSATCESALLPLGVRWYVAHYAGHAAYTAAQSDAVLVNVRYSRPELNRDTTGDGRASIFLEHASGGLYITTVRGRTISDGQELAGPGSGWDPIQFGDFNGDGRTDILMRSPEGRLEIWLLEGIGTVTRLPVESLPAGSTIAALGDFNGDGRTDLLEKAADGSLTARLMDGASVLERRPLAIAGNFRRLAAIDLDGDGADDLVLVHGNTIRLQSIASGTAGAAIDVEGPAEGFALVGTGDFDGDGYADLVFAKESALLVWQLGANGLVQRHAYALEPGWRYVEAIDFDGAISDEFILAGPRGEVAVWSLDANWFMASGTVFTPGEGWRFVQVADYDGNGTLDLLFESDEGELVAWLFDRGMVVARVLVSHPTDWRVIP